MASVGAGRSQPAIMLAFEVLDAVADVALRSGHGESTTASQQSSSSREQVPTEQP